MIDCYREQYGDETDALFAAMAMPQKKIALINQFIPPSARADLCKEPLSYGTQFAMLAKDTAPFFVDGLLSHYFLDVSSIFAPLLLPLAPAMRVLDMCSAPGGKLLVMLSRLIKDIDFIANDLSPARTERLRRVLREYVPDGVMKHVRVANRDAISFALREPASFDAVLLDAPCSSEAHILNDQKLLRRFTGLRRSLSQRQYSLLSAALLAVKPGGHVMYATCSINRQENEGVIMKALARKKTPCELIGLSPPLGRANEFGATILPHVHGAGPAFFALLRRI
jgi:16S rRNA C967 or C1407 C5-methylase (RsmB/RsmF family)